MKSMVGAQVVSKSGPVSIMCMLLGLWQIANVRPVLKAGKIVLQGRHVSKKVRLGKRMVSFYSLQADETLRLRIAGPASVVVQARGRAKSDESIEKTSCSRVGRLAGPCCSSGF